MADIFLSYAREDAERARRYAEAFLEIGWSVFWDPQILPGSTWDEVIEDEITQCKCVVVLWSAVSVKKTWVKNEASHAEQRGVLVPVAIDRIELPLAFRHRQSAQLQDWKGSSKDAGFAQLLKAIARHVPKPKRRDTAVSSPPASSHRPVGRTPPAPEERSRPSQAVEVAWPLPDDSLVGFVKIPAGPFIMGSDRAKDSFANDNELPAHQVVLPDFFIGRCQVTIGQFKAYVHDGGSWPAEAKALHGADDQPVRFVSWHEALGYCGWLKARLKGSARTPAELAELLKGHGGRAPWHVSLPSEAEWEKAARGPDGRIYPWGDRYDPTRTNDADAKRTAPTPVGSFPGGASPYGVLDMTGNVCEWTRSHYKPYPYVADDGRENLAVLDYTARTIRSSSWNCSLWGARAAAREYRKPNLALNWTGFRVVLAPIQG